MIKKASIRPKKPLGKQFVKTYRIGCTCSERTAQPLCRDIGTLDKSNVAAPSDITTVTNHIQGIYENAFNTNKTEILIEILDAPINY